VPAKRKYVKTRDSKRDPEKLLMSSPEVREEWGG